MGTLVCVPIMVRDADAALAEAVRAREAGADLIEWRVDELYSDVSDIGRVSRLVAASPAPCIVTCRPVWEGGGYDGDEDARIALFEHLGVSAGRGAHPPRYIDAELRAYTASENIRRKIDLAVDHPAQSRDLRTSLILSVHDFDSRPADLSRRLLEMRAQPAAKVLKVAYRARSLRDNLELFDLLAERDRPMIALGMGEFGLMSRVLAPKFGALLTFAALESGHGTAAGQPTIDDLLNLYRFRSIGPETAVYGVAGWPVGHSLGPAAHNAGFAAVGIDAVYLPLPIAAEAGAPGAYESFKATVLEMVRHPRLGFGGMSVTLPHKEHIVRLAREQGWAVDADTARIGAANTVVVGRDGSGDVASVRIANTDVGAGVSVLAEAVGGLAGRRVAVIGAGGAARAFVYGLVAGGALAEVYNRSPERAAALEGEFGNAAPAGARAATPSGSIVARTLEDLARSRCDAYVNCTPLGMSGGPAPDASPLDIAALGDLRKETVFFDTVYSPIDTPMLRHAQEAGYRVLDGAAMFVRQAEAQFAMWTGSAPPTGLYDRIVRARLAGPG